MAHPKNNSEQVEYIANLLYLELQGDLNIEQKKELEAWKTAFPDRIPYIDALTNPDAVIRHVKELQDVKDYIDKGLTEKGIVIGHNDEKHRPATPIADLNAEADILPSTHYFRPSAHRVHFLRKWGWAAAVLLLMAGIATVLYFNNIPQRETVRKQPQAAGSPFDERQIKPVFDKLDTRVKKATMGYVMEQKIGKLLILGPGRMAPDFTQTDTLGRPISLSSFRGRYVLLDFWASWCKPCRVENPGVVKAYQAYKNKNFTVLGVSLDQPGGKEKWLKAIYDDGLTWRQLSDLNYWANAAAVLYNIQEIPANFLIDPSGKIIAKGLHGDELQLKLGEVLK